MEEGKESVVEVKRVAAAITKYCTLCEGETLLSCYADTEDFRAVGGDGTVRTYSEFRALCLAFYDSVSRQDMVTIKENYAIVNDDLVILSWMGNIDAYFKNGDVMKLKDYGVTFIFKRFSDGWKVIHSHESSLPPEIIKGHSDR